MVNQVRAAHILIPDEKKAKDLKAKIDAGEDFADLAKKWSHCPSKKKGGDLGWFKKGDMVPEFEAAAFAAKTGDVVGPVKTQFGWHIIKMNDQQMFFPYDSVRTDILRFIEQRGIREGIIDGKLDQMVKASDGKLTKGEHSRSACRLPVCGGW
jgi:parvulin-like peptidyl-prolyl isomerase